MVKKEREPFVNLHEFRFSRWRFLSAHFRAGILNRLHDIIVSGTAAKIPRNSPADFLLGGIWIVFEQLYSPQHHAGSAESAVESVVFLEALLNGVQPFSCGQSFDGDHFLPIGLNGQYGAGFDGFTIEQNGACSAAGGVAADMSTGHAKLFADEVNQKRPWFDLDGVLFTIDGECNLLSHLMRF